jgi:hypothetical protein
LTPILYLLSSAVMANIIYIEMILVNHKLSNKIATELFSAILAQENVLLSVNSGSGICEARIEKGLRFRIREKWPTIGDESRV